MNIDPRVEPWLIALLDGVQNSNHSAEVVATAAYAAPALVKALELLVADVAGYEAWERPCRALDVARAALALAGETP